MACDMRGKRQSSLLSVLAGKEEDVVELAMVIGLKV